MHEAGGEILWHANLWVCSQRACAWLQQAYRGGHGGRTSFLEPHCIVQALLDTLAPLQVRLYYLIGISVDVDVHVAVAVAVAVAGALRDLRDDPNLGFDVGVCPAWLLARI